MIPALILAALLVAVAVHYRQRVHALRAELAAIKRRRDELDRRIAALRIRLRAERNARRIAVTSADRAETTARQHEATVVMLLAELDRTPAALEWHGVGAGRSS